MKIILPKFFEINPRKLLQSKYEQDKDFLDNFPENPTDKERLERDDRFLQNSPNDCDLDLRLSYRKTGRISWFLDGQNERGLPMVMTEDELDYLASIKVRAEEKGLQKGLEKGRIEIALAMLADNKPVEEIVMYSHLPESKILELKASSAGDATK